MAGRQRVLPGKLAMDTPASITLVATGNNAVQRTDEDEL